MRRKDPVTAELRLRAHRIVGTLGGGSSRPLLVETDAGKFVVKLVHGPDGPVALAADWMATAIASELGLPTLEPVLIDVEPEIASEIVESELREAVERGAGLSLGTRALTGVVLASKSDLANAPDDFALRVLWLDVLIQNPDRTVDNPNILRRGASLIPIDHGAAFAFHHDWELTESLPKTDVAPPPRHVFAERVDRLPQLTVELMRALSRDKLVSICDSVPDLWLGALHLAPAQRQKAAYAAYLWKRLRAMSEAWSATADEASSADSA